jgi:hypothetical protein
VLVIAGFAVATRLAANERCRRRWALIGLSLMLSLVGFESAIHSVHHLTNPQAFDRCVVASSADHLAAVHVDGPTAMGIAVLSLDSTPPAPVTRADDARPAPFAGRAPPA